MKRIAIVTLMVLMVTLTLTGVACAADKSTGEEIVLKGMVDENSLFVDEKGQTYKIAENEQATKIMAHPGQKVEIKGTVMEKEGVKTIVVDRFMALPE